MLKRFVFFLFAIFAFCPAAEARHLSGRVVDAQTKKDIEGAAIELLSVKDSTLIRSTVTTLHKMWGWEYWGYELDVENNTDYLLRFSAVGYRTQYQKVEVRMANRVSEQRVGEVALTPEAHQLDEVVVKATMVKMVMKGDTVVFNASAFNQSEGSMLDALIRDLPGTTIKDGVISVNGRRVSSLLIDGRDFFNGDAQKALSNLPAYTVDKVKAYEKAGSASRLMGRDMGDREYVLDVNLKKQYRHGVLANADVGQGTHQRRTERLFTLGYGSKDQLSVSGFDNNVNDNNIPGENQTMASMPVATSGRTANNGVQLEFMHRGKSEDDYLACSFDARHSNTDQEERVTSQTFLSGGDYFSMSTNPSKSRNTSASGNFRFCIHPKRLNLGVDLSCSYDDGHSTGNSLSALFNDNPMGSTELLDSLFAPTTSAELLKKTINRVRNNSLNTNHSFSLNAGIYEQIALGRKDSNNQNFLQTHLTYNHSQSGNRLFSTNTIDYLQDDTPRDHRNQFNDSPSSSDAIGFNANYVLRLSRRDDKVNNFELSTTYNLAYSYSNNENALYRLDQLSDYSEDLFGLGTLPSSRDELLSVLDATNSYKSNFHQLANMFMAGLRFQHGDGTERPRWEMSLNLPLRWLNERLRYYRTESYFKSRQSLLFQPTIRVNYAFNDSTGTRYADFDYSTYQSQPDLITLLGITDDSNPLLVTEGNPHLRKARTHDIGVGFNIFNLSKQTMMNVQLNYTLVQDAIATATLYDKATGITHTHPTNVGGNWNMGGTAEVNFPFWKQRFTFELSLSSRYSHNVDLSTVQGQESARSTVCRFNNIGSMSLGYRSGEKVEIEFNASTSNQLVNGSRADFTKINSWDTQFMLQGNVELPWKLHLSTDITNYIRSGYNDEQMNTSDWIWNLRLSRPFCKGRLVAAVDAFDVLGELNNTRYTIDEQGRTETWTNSIPRYCMLHLSYKFYFGKKRE
jgi:hypothetical protein